MQNLRINGERLWATLMETAEIGKTAKGGIKRLTLTDLDRQVRDWFKAKAEEAGCTVHIDDMGNMFAIRPGRNNDLAPVACGSHLDTQPTGGKYDGILGVLAGLEAVRTLNDAGYETEAPIMVVNWTNEEGSRFAPPMLSSGVYGGAFSLDWAYAREDREGTLFKDALEGIGYRGDEPVGERPMQCFFEVHIEQGPILEAEGKTIGVVTDGQGQRWYEVTFTGFESHAGTTPMPLRKDALVAASKLVQGVQDIARSKAPDGVGTVGLMEVSPNSRNVIPGSAFLTVDFRHPDDAKLSSMDRELKTMATEIAKEQGVEVEVKDIWYFPPVRFDEDCIKAVRDAAELCGYSARDMVSGAGHDACYIARKVPTSMIFAPCEKGISHNEIENMTLDEAEASANVLLHALLSRANA